jgi:DNA (cytosine-5)-methyltransferase 1
MSRKPSDLTVTEQFCGAGGSSVGAAAHGFRLRLAMNHWRVAIETHNTNFPDADHVCADISATDPRRYPSTNVLLTSPECTNHSIAKNRPTGRPSQPSLFDRRQEEERSRATMWDVPRFAEVHGYDAIIVENVVEAAKWAGFRAWWIAMEDLGYRGQAVFLNSMVADGEVPQSRDRMYVVWTARRIPAPDLEFRPLSWCPACERVVEAYQSWKPRTGAWPATLPCWGKYRSQYLYRCHACHAEAHPLAAPAWTAIDWTIEGTRIGERNLKPATLARVARGLAKFGQLSPLVIPLDRSGDPTKNPSPAVRPFPTLTARQDKALAWAWKPFVASLRGGGSVNDQRPVDVVLSTVTASGDHHLLVHGPCQLLDGAHPQLPGTPTTDAQPAPGVGERRSPVAAPTFYLDGDGSDPSMERRAGEPLGARSYHALTSMPFTVAYYGHGAERPATEPLGTLTALDRYAAVIPAGEQPRIEDCRFRMLEPHELGRAMAFPDDYQLAGNKRQKVRQYGNAVTPPVMRLLTGRVAEALA